MDASTLGRWRRRAKGGGGGEWRGGRGEGSQINLEMVGRMEALGSVSGEWRNIRRS